MGGRPVEVVGRADLAELAEVHDRHPVAHVLDHGQVVGDEDHGEAVARPSGPRARLRIWAWTDTSRAETGSSQMSSFGSHHERPGDADPLALTAGELLRTAVAGRSSGSMPTASSISRTFRVALRPRAALPDDQRLGHDVLDPAPRVERGDRVLEDHLDLGPGSRAARRRDRRGEVVALEDAPSREVGRWTWTRARPVVDLPQPDSPTSPSVSPSATSKLTPETAWTVWPPLRNSTTQVAHRRAGVARPSRGRASGAPGRGQVASAVPAGTRAPVRPAGPRRPRAVPDAGTSRRSRWPGVAGGARAAAPSSRHLSCA